MSAADENKLDHGKKPVQTMITTTLNRRTASLLQRSGSIVFPSISRMPSAICGSARGNLSSTVSTFRGKRTGENIQLLCQSVVYQGF